MTEAAKAKGADMENLRPKAEMADVEKPKSETKITKNLDETEENSQANLKDDRSSNFATNKDKDINDFNHTTKIKNKITHKSALDEMTQQTEHHEARKEGEERQASTPTLCFIRVHSTYLYPSAPRSGSDYSLAAHCSKAFQYSFIAAAVTAPH